MKRYDLEQFEEFIKEQLKDGNGVIQYRNMREADCFREGCDCHLLVGEGYRVPTKYGVRVVCSRHFYLNGLAGYHGNASDRRYNDRTIGTPKKTSLTKTTVGCEIETSRHGLSDVAYTYVRMLIEHCMLVRAERDGSITGAEYPTEKMEGLSAISHILSSLEAKGILDVLTNDDSLGAHVHVKIDDMDYLRRYYQSILFPLNDYIAEMPPAKRLQVFGSDFRYYAKNVRDRVDNYTRKDAFVNIHEIMFNAQHNHTLEFRLPRITGTKQYINVLKFWREIGWYINNFDFNKNASADIRKTSAQRCGQELVKIARKYF